MPLEKSKQEEIRQAVAAGKTPNRQASGRVTLPLTGKRYAVLSSGGKETPQGAFYKTLVGEGQGLGGLGGDRVVRPDSGNREFLQTRARKTPGLSLATGEQGICKSFHHCSSDDHLK